MLDVVFPDPRMQWSKKELETKFVQAHDWANNTGQGVREQDGQETFENLICQRCRWYFDLFPIMGDRSKATPPVTTDNLLESDAESGLSDSVVEEMATKRKSDVSSRASTKTSRKTPPNSSSKKTRKNTEKLASLRSICQPKQSHKQLDGRKLQDTTKNGTIGRTKSKK